MEVILPRIPRNYYSSNFFHIIVQGIRKEYIFDKEKLIKKYKEIILANQIKYDVTIIAYCIMSNHAHMLLYCENIESMSAFMKSVNTSYALFYNKFLERVGYVFRDRFVSEPINTITYLLNCIAYIHNNPVKARMVTSVEKYPYSSYMDYIEKKGIATEKVINMVFEDSSNYTKTFIEIHKSDAIFKEFDEEPLPYESIIKAFITNRNKPISEICEDEKLLYELVEELKKTCGLSIRKICEILNMNRSKLRRMLHLK